MKFDKLAAAYLKVLTESQSIDDLSRNFTILGIQNIETDGHDTFVRDEFGRTAIEVTFKYKNDEPGIFLYKGRNGFFEEWGEELYADTNEGEDWEDFVNAIFVAIKSKGGKSENAEDKEETSQEWELKRHAREQNKWDKRKERWDAFKKANPNYKKNR